MLLSRGSFLQCAFTLVAATTCFVSVIGSLNSTGMQCDANVVATVTNSTTMDAFGNYESYSVNYKVTLDACAICFATANVRWPTDSAWKANSTAVTLLRNQLAGNEEIFKAIRQRFIDRIDVPAWLRDDMLLEYYDRFIGPNSTRSCLNYPPVNISRENEPFFSVNRFGAQSYLVDLTSLRAVPWSQGCGKLLERTPFTHSLQFYQAFFGFRLFGNLLPGPDIFAATNVTDRIQRSSVLVGAYATPITLCTLGFSLYVIRTSLHSSDSHIYLYHRALLQTDMFIAVFMFLRESHLLVYLWLPICYAAPTASTVAFTTEYSYITSFAAAGQNVMLDLYAVFPLLFAFTFASVIEALLAIDRLLALTCPLFYRDIADTKHTWQLILAAGVLNAVASASEVCTEEDFRRMVGLPRWTALMPFGKLPRVLLLTVSLCIQVVCCSTIFAKFLARHFSQTKKHRDTQQISRKLVPFYLLFGTCGVGMLAVSLEIFLVLSHIQIDSGLTINLLLSPALMALVPAFEKRYHAFVVSGSSSWGLLLHLLVSKDCRDVAKQSLASGWRRMTGRGKTETSTVAPASQSSSSGKTARTSTISVAPLSTPSASRSRVEISTV